MALVAPEVMLNSIMGKIYSVLTSGDDSVPKSEDNFFSWATPGIPVEAEDFRFLKQGFTGVVRKAAVDAMASTAGTGQAELTPELLEQLRATDAAQLILQAESFARLVDFVPDLATTTNNQFASLRIMNNEGTLSERYDYILRMSQIMHAVLPEDTKKKIEKFRALLQTTKTTKNLVDDSDVEVTEPSPLVQAYNQKMAAYEDAALLYNARRVDALAADNQKAVQYWAINANILRNKVKAAMSDWVSSGYKNDFEQISAFIDQVMARDMSLLKQQYRDDLEKARLTGLTSGSDFFYAALVPGNPLEASGWTEFGFASSDFNNESNSSFSMKRSKTSGGGGFLGIGGGGGSASSTSINADSHVQFDSNTFRLNFKIAQVPIVRPWFKTAFLTSKCWRMDQSNPQAKGEMASDGGEPATGILPAYPTSIILIKDLVMKVSNSSGFSNFASSWKSSSVSGGGFVSFGPLHLGGSHGRSSINSKRSSDFHYDSEDQTMSVPGAQIIGFKCHIFPKSPDPLSSITSWI